MNGRTQSYQAGIIYVLLATLGWSLSGLFVRAMPDLDGWQINCWRGFWTGIALLVYLFLTYGRGALGKFNAVPLPALLMTALFFSVGSTFYVASLTHASTALVSVIGATAPLVTAMLSPWVTHERPGLSSWLAACLGLIGIVIIVQHELRGGDVIGILFAAFIPLTFAGQTLALRRYRHIDMVPAICIGGFVSFLLAGCLGFVAGDVGGGFNVPGNRMLLLVLMSVIQLALPLLLYSWGARSVSAVTLTVISTFDVILNPLWTWLVFKEHPSKETLIGGGVVLAAILLSIFGPYLLRQRQKQENNPILPTDLH